jgi:hypothetical protein
MIEGPSTGIGAMTWLEYTQVYVLVWNQSVWINETLNRIYGNIWVSLNMLSCGNTAERVIFQMLKW